MYVDAHKPKIKSLSKHPTHDAVFDNKYMKLCDARLNAIRTFGLYIKQFFLLQTLIFQTFWKHFVFSFFYHLGVLNHRRLCWIWLIERKIAQIHLFISNHSWKYEIGTVVTFVFPDRSRHGNSVACTVVFPLISMRLPDSACIYTTEIWSIIKALEEIKDSVASKYIIFTVTLSCRQYLHYITVKHH